MKYLILKENIDQARKILKDVHKDINDSNFIEIRDLLGKNQGYLGLFTKLHFKYEQTIEDLKHFKNLIDDNKDLLRRLPIKLMEYTDINEFIGDLEVEKEWSLYNKEFVNKLPKRFRDKARDDAELKNMYIHLNDDGRKLIFKSLINFIADYTDYEVFKKDLFSTIRMSKSDVVKLVDQIKNTEHAYIVYNRDGIVIAEIYNFKTSCKLGAKSWCISRENGIESWNKYVNSINGHKQYFIWNFKVPSHSAERMVGVTINKNGEVTYAHLNNNTSLYSDMVTKYLKKYDIPSNILKPIDYNIDAEKLLRSNPTDENILRLIPHGAKISSETIDEIIDKIDISAPIVEMLIRIGVANEYLDYIPFNLKARFNLLSNEEISMYNKSLGIMIANGMSTEKRDLIEFYNKTTEKNANISVDNKSPYSNDMSKIDFIDKLEFIKKNAEHFTINGIQSMLHAELSNDVFDVLKVDDEIQFHIQMDIETFTSVVLTLDTEYDYYLLRHIANTEAGDVSIFNLLDAEITIVGLIPDEILEYIIMFMESLSNSTIHKEHKKVIDDNIYELREGYHCEDLNDIIYTYDTMVGDAFTHNVVNKMLGDLDDEVYILAKEDADKLEDRIVGYYDESHETWILTIDELIGLLPDSDIEGTFNIDNWIDTAPLDTTDIDFNFGEFIDVYNYLDLVDVKATLAVDVIINEVQDLIKKIKNDGDLNKKHQVNEYIDMEYETMRHGMWFGYMKKIGSKIFILNTHDTGTEESVYIYELNGDIQEYSDILIKSNPLPYSRLCFIFIDELEKVGVKIHKIPIDDFIQSKGKVDFISNISERIKTFKSFISMIK